MLMEKTVICFGEVLWDCLPKGLFLGGAPVNVAFHVQQNQNFTGFPVSAVGNDFLGGEIIRRLQSFGIPTHGIYLNEDRLTGAVIAEIDSHGNAEYRFLDDVAWDKIIYDEECLPDSQGVEAIVYGTLAFRCYENESILANLLARYPGARKVCDINLRKPFDNLDKARKLCQKADLVKLNHDELARLLDKSSATNSRDVEVQILALHEQMPEKDLCVTAGASGAGIFRVSENKWFWEDAVPVSVRDTVGAGDCFLATLIVALADGLSSGDALRKACRMGEFVASQDGAMPLHPEN
nr:hypothetical protein [Cytophagales bacterium]